MEESEGVVCFRPDHDLIDFEDLASDFEKVVAFLVTSRGDWHLRGRECHLTGGNHQVNEVASISK